MLAFSTYINACIEESSEQTSIAEQHTQKLIVIDVNIVKACCVKKIVPVNKYRHPAAMSELPRNIIRRIEVHVKVYPIVM